MHNHHRSCNHPHCSPVLPKKTDGSTFSVNIITRIATPPNSKDLTLNGVFTIATNVPIPECASFIGIDPGPMFMLVLNFSVPDWYTEDKIYLRVSVPSDKTPIQVIDNIVSHTNTSKTVKIGINWFSIKVEARDCSYFIQRIINEGCTIVKQSLTMDEQTQKLIDFDSEESIPDSKPSGFQLFKEAIKLVLEYSKDDDWNAWARPIVNGNYWYLKNPTLEKLLERIQANPCDLQSWDVSYATRAILEAGILLCKMEENEADDWQVKQAAEFAISNIQSHLRNINNGRVYQENLSK